MDIEIQHNSGQIAEAFNQLLQQTQNLEPAMRQIAGVLADASEESFEQQRTPDGTPWAGLSEETTIPAREAQGYWPGQILQVTGDLAASITTDYGDDYASIGTNKIYAPMMHFGGTTSPDSMIPNKEIPGREFLGLGPQDEDEVLDILGDFLMQFDEAL